MARFLANENAPREAVLAVRSPEIVTAFIVSVLSQPIDWTGHFTVGREGSLRVIRLQTSAEPDTATLRSFLPLKHLFFSSNICLFQ